MPTWLKERKVEEERLRGEASSKYARLGARLPGFGEVREPNSEEIRVDDLMQDWDCRLGHVTRLT